MRKVCKEQDKIICLQEVSQDLLYALKDTL